MTIKDIINDPEKMLLYASFFADTFRILENFVERMGPFNYYGGWIVDIANQVNAVAMVNRTTEEMKKKWADMQSLTKKKEAERRRSMKQTGGGPAPNFMFKNWENLVLQSLSDVAIEGISGGVDTAECESRPSPVVPAGIIIHEVPASENSELSESASTPCARMTSINNSTYKDMNFESESSQSQERPRKQTRVQRKENEVPGKL
uniref:Myb/SANT-like DNA-binding domain-containing protein n=1 Tax=Magallana gigas TaxID=29159 RepID=A0A8W8M6T6_MAGGI